MINTGWKMQLQPVEVFVIRSLQPIRNFDSYAVVKRAERDQLSIKERMYISTQQQSVLDVL